MNKFDEIYFKIINESKFSNKKWKFDSIYESIEIYENFNHLKIRLFERYKKNLETWIIWNTVKTYLIDYLIEKSYFDKCSKNGPQFQKMMICHLTLSNIWSAYIIQNDLDDKTKRIYFSTFLPDPPKIPSGIELIEIDL